MSKITDKQKCIAEQALYDLKGWVVCDNEWCEMNLEDAEYPNQPDWIKPLLRPMSDLYKETTHKGYNDDKLFSPIIELAKISMQDAIRKEYWKPQDFIIDGDQVRLGDYSFFYEKRECFSWSYKYSDMKDQNALYQLQMYDFLNMLHFDTRGLIEKGEAIDVNTLKINPYEV